MTGERSPMTPDPDDDRPTVLGRLRTRLRTMDRQAIFWALFVVVFLLAALIFILVTGPGSPCHECSGGA